MRFLLIALCAALTLSSGCDTDPCGSREARAAFVGLGGPLGVAAVLALSCPAPAPEPPIAAVPRVGHDARQAQRTPVQQAAAGKIRQQHLADHSLQPLTGDHPQGGICGQAELRRSRNSASCHAEQV